MSSISTFNNNNALASYIKRGWEISKTASKPYKITMLVLAIIIFAANWSILQVVFKEGDDIKPLVARSLLDSCLYLALCHFFIRPYLKLSFINHRPVNTKAFAQNAAPACTLNLMPIRAF